MDISATVVIYETLIVNIYQTFEEKRSVQYMNEERPKLNRHRYNTESDTKLNFGDLLFGYSSSYGFLVFSENNLLSQGIKI